MNRPLTGSSGPRFSGRRVLVTGADSSVGAAVARRLAAEGADVVVSGQDADRCDRVTERIQALDGRAWSVPADPADERAVAGLVGRCSDLMGGLDLMVTTCGWVPEDPWTTWSRPDWTGFLTREVVSVLLLTRAARPLLVAGVAPTIVLVGGVAGVGSDLAPTLLAGGLDAVARGLRAELGLEGVAVHGIGLDPADVRTLAVPPDELAATVLLVDSGEMWPREMKGTQSA
jgi:NAD(P)-dependent dehydrogenase (short-subunit alcohol dehydrogenase family)